MQSEHNSIDIMLTSNVEELMPVNLWMVTGLKIYTQIFGVMNFRGMCNKNTVATQNFFFSFCNYGDASATEVVHVKTS
jgi:hypothetical protein